MTETRMRVGPADDFAEGSLTAVTIGNQQVVVVRQGGKFYAVPDRCTHAKFPLHDGELIDGKIRCVHHGASFDLETGRPTLPAVKKLRLFDVEVDAGMLYVTVQEA